MKTLDEQWLKAKRERDNMTALHGPRSQRAKAAHERMMDLTARILRRDNRRRKAA